VIVGVISLVVGVFGLALAFAGLRLAFVQLRRVKSVADAALVTSNRNQRRVSGAMVLARTADLETATVALRSATEGGDRERAKELVQSWRRYASEYQGLLTSASVSDQALEGDLEVSLGLVETALDELADPAIVPAASCRFILRHMGDACGHGRRVAAAMMVSTEP
jgi:hypothetical protein